MNQILIATHSTLAQGFHDAIKFFHAGADNVHYINAYVETPNFEEQFLDQVTQLCKDNLIVFTDIVGGSVNQVAMKHMQEYGYHLISGCNLAVLLETVFLSEQVDSKKVREIIMAGSEQLRYMNDLLMQEEEDEK